MKPAIMMNVGKGGVGKTTTTVARALRLARLGKKVGLIDCDGGNAHSVARALGIDSANWKLNVFNETSIPNLFIALVDGIEFEPIEESKKKGKGTPAYLKQFVADYMLIPFCDMLMTFFGVPTDIEGTSNFLTLIQLYHDAKEKDFEYLVIDVEPTTGLKRLLNNTEVISRSLCGLQEKWLTLRGIAIFWKDIGAYLQSRYIRKDISMYTQRMMNTATAIRGASFTIVTIPESSPVEQAFGVVELVESFGGKISGFVLNNVRLGEGQTKSQIERVMQFAYDRPVVQILHKQILCDDAMTGRQDELERVGKLLEDLA